MISEPNSDTPQTPEEKAIAAAEAGYASADSLNMQLLQSFVGTDQQDPFGGSSLDGVAQSLAGSTSSVPQSLDSAGSAYVASATVMAQSAMTTTDQVAQSGAAGLMGQVAAAAPTSFGKQDVGGAAQLSALGDLATVAAPVESLAKQEFQPPKLPVDPANPGVNVDGANSSIAPEFAQLAAMLGLPDLALGSNDLAFGIDSGVPLDASDPASALVSGAILPGSVDSYQAAIDAITAQLDTLQGTFEPLMENLSQEVVSQVNSMSTLSSADLGLSIQDDSSNLSNDLTDFIGTVDNVSLPDISNLLDVGATIDDIVSLIGSLPNLDLNPEVITDTVITPVTDVVGGITDPITDVVGGITDPITDVVGGITDPITDVVGGITDPITDVVGGITDPITDVVDGVTDPITDVVDGVTDPITDPITDTITEVITGGGGLLGGGGGGGLLGALESALPSSGDGSGGDLLGSATSGISSNASDGHGPLDPLAGLDHKI